jgi:DNA-binding CsgD family transcriptional regulator
MAKNPGSTPPQRSGALPEARDKRASASESVPAIVSSSLESRPRSERAAEAVLDKLNRGILIFDQDGRVHFANDAALRLIQPTAAMAVEDGHLVFNEPEAQAKLLSFLNRSIELVRASSDAITECSTVMCVDAGPGRGPYRLLLCTLSATLSRDDGTSGLRHVLMIYEPHAGRQVSKRILTDLYNLSDAEAALTLQLFTGESLEDAADQLCVSINTAKTHLQHIFLKCEVHSQGELLQLLSLGPRTL